MMSLDAPPKRKKPASQPSRLLVLGAFAVAIAVVVTAIVAVGISREDAEPLPEAATGTPSNAEVDIANVETVLPASSVESAATDSEEPTVSTVATTDDPIAAGTAEACRRFRSGATVADFAAWFETEVGTVGVAEQELFRSILQRALTTECPEVVPAGS